MFFWSKSVQCGTIETCNVRTLVKTNVAVISLFQICHNITERQRTPSRSLEYKLTCNAFFDAVFVKFFFLIQKLGNSGEINATCWSSDGERWFRTINLDISSLQSVDPCLKRRITCLNSSKKLRIKRRKTKAEIPVHRMNYFSLLLHTCTCMINHIAVWNISILYCKF